MCLSISSGQVTHAISRSAEARITVIWNEKRLVRDIPIKIDIQQGEQLVSSLFVSVPAHGV